MKKVLIWDSFPLKNIGGPFGYCYNLHEFLKEHPTNQITFLSDFYPSGSEASCSVVPKRKGWKRILNNQFMALLNEWAHLLFLQHHNTVTLPENIDLNDYDYIHFHQTPNVTGSRDLLKNFKGKIILTTHSPCPRTDEMLSLMKSWKKIYRPIMLSNEILGFKEADYLMFPVKGAREPYEKEPRIKKHFQSREDSIFYCPSAINDCPVDENKMQTYKVFGIPEDAFVITYFGRHNTIKGYDILKNVGEVLLDKYPNLYFLCAGKGEIAPLDHPRWKELGFISNTHELLWQSDLYILPNRETYFDLVVLEILRSRTPLILSSTGGNEYFKGLPKDEIVGLDFFDINNFERLMSIVESNIQLKINAPELYKQKGEHNRRLWMNYFTMEKFVKRYLQAIENLK